jgi:glycosyltransferase involved in cell wall biosynthesis
MPQWGVEILISDRHCYDDTIDRLAKRYATDPRVCCLKHQDGLDWVGHLNALLEAARGEYWRFLPHDDQSPPGSLEALIAALDAHPEAVLAYGPTRVIDGEGRSLRDRDHLNPHPKEAIQGWTLGLILQMYWKTHYIHAFKGLIRRRMVMENRLLIRSTSGQVRADRCWLFALCLLGRFCFVPEAIYIKRVYPGSTNDQWTITGRTIYNNAWVMSGYLWDLLGPLPARWYGVQDLWLNAMRRARWHQNSRKGRRPSYRIAPGLLPWLLNREPLSGCATLRAFVASRHLRIDTLRKLPLPQRHQSPDWSSQSL